MKIFAYVLAVAVSQSSWALGTERSLGTATPSGITEQMGPMSKSEVHEYLSVPVISEADAVGLMVRAWDNDVGHAEPGAASEILAQALLPYMIQSGVCAGGILEADGLICAIANPFVTQRQSDCEVAAQNPGKMLRRPSPSSALMRIYYKALAYRYSQNVLMPTALPASFIGARESRGLILVVHYDTQTSLLSVGRLEVTAGSSAARSNLGGQCIP